MRLAVISDIHGECLALDQVLQDIRRQGIEQMVCLGDALAYLWEWRPFPTARSAHLPGAKWISRGWIELKLPEKFPDRTQPIVVTCPDGQQSIFAARALAEIGYTDIAVLNGGVRAWSAAELPMEHGLETCLVPTNDVVLSPSIRGDKEDMQRYLDWELKLQR